MTEALRLYGTEIPPIPAEQITLADIAFSLQDGAVRHLKVGGVEILRAIAFLVRDRDWGTLVPALDEVSRKQTASGVSLHLRAVYRAGEATLAVDLFLDLGPASLTFRASGHSSGAFETNRTGFSVLHPADLAGAPVTVSHSDGTTQGAAFPDLIDPWQPFLDIVSLTHRAEGLAVTCAFEGDTFEMEDQRQWGDASFKTYNRPLARPWPYVLADGAPFAQSVAVSWQADLSAPPVVQSPPGTACPFPDTALLVTADQASRLGPDALADVAPQRLLCHVDTTLGDVAGQIAAFAALQSRLPGPILDLELVCGFDAPPAEELHSVRRAMDAAGFRPASVLVCPSADSQSTPPGSDWPACPPLTEIHAASAAAFPDLVRGGGMVTFFPELNRKRPPTDQLDFVSHGLCPIVHDAGDLSVMETLTAVPHITRSARAILGDCSYRIGPATLAMRRNPYGQRTLPNPRGDRICMTDDDPRHRARFGAAYTIGLAAALAPAGIAVWTPAEVDGPRGLTGPIRNAIAALARLAGQPVTRAEITAGLATLEVGATRLRANLTPHSQAGLGPYDWTHEALT